MLLAALFTWIEAMVGKPSGKLELAEAFNYILNRREALSRFVTDGRLEADDNIAENGMRTVALGRKNWLHVGSEAGGDRAASLYTLIATARLNGLSPEAYLKEVPVKLPRDTPSIASTSC